MRILRISALMLFSTIILLFLYANFRKVSPTERLEPVSLAIFDLHGDFSKTSPALVEQKLNKTTGVTACRVNHEAQVASVVYYTKKTTIESLQRQFLSTAQLSASVKTFQPIRGGCPVRQVSNSFSRLISTLDLR